MASNPKPKKKKKPLIVYDPNDSRLQAFKDSTTLHNLGEAGQQYFDAVVAPLIDKYKAIDSTHSTNNSDEKTRLIIENADIFLRKAIESWDPDTRKPDNPVTQLWNAKGNAAWDRLTELNKRAIDPEYVNEDYGSQLFGVNHYKKPKQPYELATYKQEPLPYMPVDAITQIDTQDSITKLKVIPPKGELRPYTSGTNNNYGYINKGNGIGRQELNKAQYEQYQKQFYNERLAQGGKIGSNNVNLDTMATKPQNPPQEPQKRDPEFLYFDQFNTKLTAHEEIQFKKWFAAESQKRGRNLTLDQGSYDVSVGLNGQSFKNFGAVIAAQRQGSGSMVYVDAKNITALGMPIGFNEKEFSSSEVTMRMNLGCDGDLFDLCYIKSGDCQ